MLSDPRGAASTIAGPGPCKHPDCYVLADEIYKDILYTGEHHSISTFPGMADRTIILDGFSKSYAMTGWRLGYGIMPPELVPHVVRLAVNSVSCAATFTQKAGHRGS